MVSTQKIMFIIAITILFFGCISQEEPKGCEYNDPACKINYDCINNKCILKQGCSYDNSLCDYNHTCLNNSCVLKSGCQHNNPACDENQDCINNSCVLKKGCEYNFPTCLPSEICVNNTCVLKPGCQYNNPVCGEDYNCVNNSCVLKKGCKYNNPACSYKEKCTDNYCIERCEIPSSLYKSKYSIGGNNYDVYTEPGSSFRIVCQQPCTIDEKIIKAKYSGAKKAIEDLIQLTGVDVDDSLKPIDIHLNGDAECGSAEDMIERHGFVTGFSSIRTADWHGYLCLFDVEKPNRILEFNEENACRIEDQGLLVHEYAHELFNRRSYIYTESLVKSMSFYVSGQWTGGGYYLNGDWIELGYAPENFPKITDACDERLNLKGENLVYLLCKNHGFQFTDYKTMMRRIVQLYESEEGEISGILVSEAQFKQIIDEIVGEDTEDTFIEAGIPREMLS